MDQKRDVQARRARYRAWHRGTREMDFLLGRFADENIARFSAGELDRFEQLLEEADRDLFDWVTGKTVAPAHLDGPLIAAITARAGARGAK